MKKIWGRESGTSPPIPAFPTCLPLTGRLCRNEGSIPLKGRTAKNIFYQPGVLGGLKFGRYFDSLPWFGIEGETSLSRNNIRGNQGRISPPLPGGPNNLFGGSDWFIDWTMQMSFMARHGFLKDKEVTFGRLQPYVGIGPGWEVVYATHDSAKNYAIEAQAGVRYMVTEEHRPLLRIQIQLSVRRGISGSASRQADPRNRQLVF